MDFSNAVPLHTLEGDEDGLRFTVVDEAPGINDVDGGTFLAQAIEVLPNGWVYIKFWGGDDEIYPPHRFIVGFVG